MASIEIQSQDGKLHIREKIDLLSLNIHQDIKKLEFRESDMSPRQTEVKQGKFAEFITRAKGYLKRNL